MTTLAEVIYSIEFSKAKLKNLKDAEREAEMSAKRIREAFSKAAIVLGAAAAGAAVSIFKLVESTAKVGDEVAKTSKGLGIAARELQRLRFAAERSGGSAEGMTRALRTMTVGLQDAATKGTGPVAEGLAAIGLSADNLKGRGIEDQFEIVASALGRVDDQATRSAIAMQIFGSRGGAAIKPLLDTGPEGIRAMGDEAERLGIVLGGETLRQSEQFADDLLDLKGVIRGLTADISSGLLPQVSGYLAQAREWIISNRELLKIKVREWLDKIVAALQDLVGLATTVVEAGTSLIEMFGGVENAATVAAVAFGAFKLAALGLPGVVFGVTAAVGVALGDLMFGLTDTLERIRQIRAETAEIKRATAVSKEDTDQLEMLGRYLDGANTGEGLRKIGALSDAEFERMISAAERSRGDASGAVIDRARSDRALGKELIRAGRSADAKQAYLDQRARTARVQKARGRKGGGRGGSSDEILIDTKDDIAEAEFGAEIRALAERFGAGAIAVDRALTSGAESLAGGATRSVARNAALSTLGGLVGQDLTAKTSDPLLSELLGEDVPDVELSTLARGAEPQVLISTINNHFSFENEYTINGAGEPAEVGRQIAHQLRDAFQGSISQATKTTKVRFAR